MHIKEVSEKIHKTAKDKGFYDKEFNVGEKLMLVTSELGEALEAHRKNKFYDKEVDFVTHNQGDFFETVFIQHCKDTFEDELADATIRLFDLAEAMGINLEWHIEMKMRYNSTRDRLHGKKY